MEETIANFAAACARKLQEQHCCCQAITIFAHTSRFRMDLPQDVIYRTIALDVPTKDMQEIVSTAVRILRQEWKSGEYLYKKAGVFVWNICRDNAIQTSLFDSIDRQKQKKLSEAIARINRKNGHDTVKVAVQGTEKRWHLKQEHLSRQYTTNLADIIQIRC